MNTVSAGPLRTMAGKGIPGFDAISRHVGAARAARLGHRPTRPPSATPSRSCSRTCRQGITGEMIHVDGGFHAMGTDLSLD